MADSAVSDETDGFKDDLSRDPWVGDPAGPRLLSRMSAEATGTFALVLIGVGTALYLPLGGNGTIAVGLAFGITMMGVVVAFRHISGAHVNPAVTIGAWLAGRFPAKDIAPYILAQVAGAVVAGATVVGLANSNPQITDPAAAMATVANGFGDHSPTQFGLTAVLIAEFLAAALFMGVILSATSARANLSHAPFAVGLAYTVLLVWAIPFANGVLNPARATSAALFAEAWALQQLWAFWLAPIVGAAIVGLLYRAFGPEEDFLHAELIEPAHEE